MAKHRYIKDSFWTDPYIEKLTPDEKLIFLYLLTNPQCNIAGVYEIRPKRVAYETGYDVEVIETILKRFIKDQKIIRINDWLIVINHIKHQSLGSKVAEGINRIIEESPKEIQAYFSVENRENENNEIYPIYTLSIPYQNPRIVKLSKVVLSNIVLDEKKNEIEPLKYGEFENVKLSTDEHMKLVERFGLETTTELIEELGGYLASTNKRYASHYATLLNWARRKKTEKNYKKKNITVI